MNLLITAGNTMALVDRVRCLTNIFTGRTGAAIALAAQARGHTVTLLTSHPEAVLELGRHQGEVVQRWCLRRYRTFEDLQELMKEVIGATGLDAVIHCAAVSDYLSAGVYSPAEGTRFQTDTATWEGIGNAPPRLIDRAAGKVKSDEPELWLRLVRAPKLVDRVRSTWGFTGLLVKFKLEVSVSDEDLLAIAERSRLHSRADLMVANTLEDAASHAFIGPLGGAYRKVSRAELAATLLQTLERLGEERDHG